MLDYFDASMKKSWLIFACMLWPMILSLFEESFIPFLFKLMVAGSRTNEFVRKTPKPNFVSCSNPMVRQFPRKMPIVTVIEKT